MRTETKLESTWRVMLTIEHDDKVTPEEIDDALLYWLVPLSLIFGKRTKRGKFKCRAQVVRVKDTKLTKQHLVTRGSSHE